MGLRRLRALIDGLPRDSAFIRKVHPHPDWTQTHELMATLIEAVDFGNRVLWSVNRDKHSPKAPDPIKIPRPWRKDEKRRKATVTELRQFVGDRLKRG